MYSSGSAGEFTGHARVADLFGRSPVVLLERVSADTPEGSGVNG